MSHLSFDQQRIVKHNESIEWARNILANKDKYIILNTETTGLKETDLVIHFAAMDLDRNMLINSLVKPTQKKRMSQEAQNIHGISMYNA